LTGKGQRAREGRRGAQADGSAVGPSAPDPPVADGLGPQGAGRRERHGERVPGCEGGMAAGVGGSGVPPGLGWVGRGIPAPRRWAGLRCACGAGGANADDRLFVIL
jgi:hypothetical protein